MFEINNTKTFKDSVHGYINIPKCFVETLIDNEYFQRLRNIEQTGMRVLYPNAKHDRFSHSLGVFHIGNRAVDALLENFSRDQYWNIESDNQSILFWAKNKVLFLIACLLHDIGHAPFSHALEAQILKNTTPPPSRARRKKGETVPEKGYYITNFLKRHITEKEKAYMTLKYNVEKDSPLDIDEVAPHEQLGALLIIQPFFTEQIIKIFESLHNSSFPQPEGKSILYAEYYQDQIVIDNIDKSDDKSMTVFEDDLCFIARMIMGLKYEDWHPERQIRNCFIELLNGKNFDVDKLDYIVRDTQMSGIKNISLDVDRLVSSLCIITKTKHLNKVKLEGKQLQQMTITEIKNNDANNVIEIDGRFHGTLIISKGTTVTIESDSTIDILASPSGEETRICYKTAQKANFEEHAIVKQEGELQAPIIQKKGDEIRTIQLDGKNTSPFYTYIENAPLISDFYFSAYDDVMLKIRKNCKIKIEGKFRSEGSIRLFDIKNMNGDISEVELLSDTFKKAFTKNKIPGEFGYNTFSIGFQNKAINVIANVIDARNYLYLWIYAHHKVIYYANFLIPVLAKELLPGQDKNDFPNKRLNFDNIKLLDDAYIWTAMQYIRNSDILKGTPKDKELKALLDELFTRKYKKSLYKSLAEYDLYFEKYDIATKIALQDYINSHLINFSSSSKPFIQSAKMEVSKKKDFSVGYFKNSAIEHINEKLNAMITRVFSSNDKKAVETKEFKLSELVYVAVDYKKKQLDPLKTFIDMKDDIVPISQIPLLESQTNKTTQNGVNSYFYLYYTTTQPNVENESTFIKAAVKEFFDNIVETKIKNKK